MPCSPVICVLFLVGACSFDADYSGGGFRCDDGVCPPGLVCRAEGVCLPPPDAALPDAPDDIPDAREPALTCADRGALTSGVAVTGNTMSPRPATVSIMCNGFIMNGRDAVYEITVSAGDQLRVELANTSLRAYVMNDCPSACISNAVAIQGIPANVTPLAGPVFVVVDHENFAVVDTYELTVTIN